MLRAARVPGGAIAIVSGGALVFAKGFGYRDRDRNLPVTADTVYPIASTSKAFNATLLGMLVDENKLAWDEPVQKYLPRFRLKDGRTSAQVTVRDLISMQTGLPRHDWMWIDNPINRTQLVERVQYLDLSAGLRERYQYNNLSVSIAGHVAEVLTGKTWEELIRQKILEPLGMRQTGFNLSGGGMDTLSYHEGANRELLVTHRLATEVTAPSGGVIHSTVEDMARWMLFNLNGGHVGGDALITAKTLREIQSPQIVVNDLLARKPNAQYAMGWTIDSYNGSARVSHGGVLHEVNSEVMLLPDEAIGLVSFTNFAAPMLSLLLNEHALDLIKGRAPAKPFAEHLEHHERKRTELDERNASARPVEGTFPSHPVSDYAGVYEHPGYGRISIHCGEGHELVLRRNCIKLSLQHWHYDSWVAKSTQHLPGFVAHTFDRTSRLLFETSADGSIGSVSIPFEPAVAPIRFERVQG